MILHGRRSCTKTRSIIHYYANSPPEIRFNYVSVFVFGFGEYVGWSVLFRIPIYRYVLRFLLMADIQNSVNMLLLFFVTHILHYNISYNKSVGFIIFIYAPQYKVCTKVIQCSYMIIYNNVWFTVFSRAFYDFVWVSMRLWALSL